MRLGLVLTLAAHRSAAYAPASVSLDDGRQASYPEVTTVSGKITFYAAGDNCPPGGQYISYPRSPGSSAGGTGTYDDPVTFAANKEAFPPRSIIYMPKWKKYGIMEDDCQECDKDWRDGKKRHVDVWLGPDQSTAGTTDCEDTLSMNHGDYTAKIILNPNKDEEVDVVPFFDHGKCFKKVDHCHDEGNKCGNKCQAWKTGLTCDEMARAFGLSSSRFKELDGNEHLNCDGIKEGTTVCQSGSCGGP